MILSFELALNTGTSQKKKHKLHNEKSNLLCWIRSDIRLAEIMPHDFLEMTKIYSLKCILMESHIIWQFQEETAKNYIGLDARKSVFVA